MVPCEVYLSQAYSHPGSSIPDRVLLVSGLLLVLGGVRTYMATDWWSSQACFFFFFPGNVRLTNYSDVQSSELLSATYWCIYDTAAMPAMRLVAGRSLFLSLTCRDLG